jgi:ribonuclease E
MADKMLIDATHPEETRVVVLRGNRVEEFDFESANRKQLRGNIYLAKVTRVEPSLQAAFVDYGGNRHGFLAFSEIHPDYYQIPVADRQALLAEEARAHHDTDDDGDNRSGRRGRRHRGRGANRRRDVKRSDPLSAEETASAEAAPDAAQLPPSEDAFKEPPLEQTAAATAEIQESSPDSPLPNTDEHDAEAAEAGEFHDSEDIAPPSIEAATDATEREPGENEADHTALDSEDPLSEASAESGGHNGNGDDRAEEEGVESVGGADALEEAQERKPRFRRQYKIQEVIKRRQVMLVQVVKEERGTKGAALTTYLSLAGRYSVLMPNTARGGGISRKITSSEDRTRLKEIAQDLEVPEGMGVILRTAGASRTKSEVKRDFEYLLRLWETVRDLTLKSMAPMLVYEEGSLVKRSIRDLYSKDIDEVIVAGGEGFKEARDFMRMLMPSHAKNVKPYKDTQPIFTRYGIESQLDAMFSPVVQLKSGGYIVINQAEALVAIDVNSGRATREHHIEDTALKTNCESADEIARQLRLRDLAGLIVIDFIDMDESRNNRTVERRLKEALKHDRARIQVGRISHFGLLEMSRQRIRTSVLESSTEKCPVCGGSGHVRSVSSVALQLLRALEEMLIKGATHNLIVRTRAEVALYVLNHKRAHLRELEERFRVTLTVSADDTVAGQTSYIIDRGEQVHSVEAARALAQSVRPSPLLVEEESEATVEGEAADVGAAEPEEVEAEAGEAREGEREGGRRRRRRGRGRGRNGELRDLHDGAQGFTRETVAEHAIAHEDHNGSSQEEMQAAGVGRAEHEGEAVAIEEDDENRRRRRRGRRGGRRNRRGRNGEGAMPAHETDRGLEAHALADDFGPPAESASHELPDAASFHESAQAAMTPPTAEAEFPPPSAAPEASEPETPRRRSTVREPAPSRSMGNMPPPTLPQPSSPPPAISLPSSEDNPQPKRGWWAKRLLGDKS